MLIPLSWLAELVEIRGDLASLCSALTNAGLETEVHADKRLSWDGVITAKLLAVDPHPGADRLTVTRPTDGTSEYTVVCGATNHKPGDVVALATIGAKLPGGFQIKRSKIRGVESEGMLCSQKELGISEESAGILILPPETPLGRPLGEVISAGDVVLEVSITANRGDALSALGVAREIAAVTGWPLKGIAAEAPPANAGNNQPSGAAAGVTVEIADPAGCPRYAAAYLAGVKVGPAPEWMRSRLELCGLRSINNVVDCTNYAMLELGNPLHAFDAANIRGQKVIIRRASEGEPAATLDGKAHALDAGDLVIADAEGAIALAGVMGGQGSEVTDGTTDLLLESAHFDPASVRRTAHRLKISSDAGYRFARGVDPALPGRALRRLIELLQQAAGGELRGEVDLYPAPVARPPVALRLSRIPGLLGLDIPAARAEELLARVGVAVAPAGEGRLAASPPSWRFDLDREVDLLEEIARLHGYEHLPEAPPQGALRSVPRRPAGPDRQAVRLALAAQGLHEAVHFSFIDPQWLEDLGLPPDHPWRARAVAIENPLSEVGGILRPTLLPSLLRAAARNRGVGLPDVRLFELRSCFLLWEQGLERDRAARRTPAQEHTSVAGVLVGRRRPAGWASPGDEAVDLYDAVGCVESVLAALGSQGFRLERGDLPAFLDEKEAAVLARGKQIAGWVGRIASPALQAAGLDAPAYAFELDIDALAPRKPAAVQFSPFSRFPAVSRDLALLVGEDAPAGQVLEAAEKAARKSLKEAFTGLELFDVYAGENIPAGQRSLALRFTFRAPDRTLEDAAIDGAMRAVEAELARRFSATVRG